MPKSIEIRQMDGGIEESQPGTLRGYAAVFGQESREIPNRRGEGFREVIRPGAFRNSLASGEEIHARIQHRGGLSMVGTTANGTLRLGEDSHGLWYEVDMPDTSAARDLAVLVKRGDIRKSSFGFIVREGGERWERSGGKNLRELTDLELIEVSMVDQPAYDGTSVSVRGEEREVESVGQYGEDDGPDESREAEIRDWEIRIKELCLPA
jgi:HK97 family phage prohead protease